MKTRKRKRSSLDKVFGTLLWVCGTAVVVSGIAWLLGWEFGPYLIVIFGALANIPMFHFAMNWPLQDSSTPEPASPDPSTTRSESPD